MRALYDCLDALLCEIQAHCLSPAPDLATPDDTVSVLFSQLMSAGTFLTDNISARHYFQLCRDWREQQAQDCPDLAGNRLLLRRVWQCRESVQQRTPAERLKQLLAERVRSAIDSLRVLPESPDSQQAWLRRTLDTAVAIVNGARFLADVPDTALHPPPHTARGLVRWLCALDSWFAADASDSHVPPVFGRELERSVGRCQVLRQELWQLQLLAGALLALESMGRDLNADKGLRYRGHCRALIKAATRAQQQWSHGAADADRQIRKVMRHALLLSSGDGQDDVGCSDSTPLTALTALPVAALTPLQQRLSAISGELSAGNPDTAADWAALSLRLYRLLVCLRMLGGGFVDSSLGHAQRNELQQWQMLVASLHGSANLCVQYSVVQHQDEACLLDLLRRLTGILQHDGEAAPDDPDLLLMAALMAARLGLRAQRHWQQLTLDLDAVQQDFAGMPVQHVLAAELHFLPAMGAPATAVATGVTVLPQDTLRDLRLLLKGARILNVQRIESLTLVMIDVYQEILASPVFAEAADISKALPRAHRSLCRMLDQAAAWQTPGDARRMINTLYACLERWRGDKLLNKTPLSAAPVMAAVNECPPGQHNDHWRGCLATNRRLRKLVRHQEDLDSIRVLLLELLRSQEDLIRRQADYGAGLDTNRQSV